MLLLALGEGFTRHAGWALVSVLRSLTTQPSPATTRRHRPATALCCSNGHIRAGAERSAVQAAQQSQFLCCGWLMHISGRHGSCSRRHAVAGRRSGVAVVGDTALAGEAPLLQPAPAPPETPHTTSQESNRNMKHTPTHMHIVVVVAVGCCQLRRHHINTAAHKRRRRRL